MKKIILSTVTIAAMSTFAVAGGDIVPVVEPIVQMTNEPVSQEHSNTDSGAYVGLGYSYMTGTQDIAGTQSLDKSYNAATLQAGYKFNPYVAVEGRYSFGFDSSVGYLGNTFDQSMDSWGLYVKPMYPVTKDIDVYALIGYASSQYNDTKHMPDYTMDGFSWGLGASYGISDNVDIYLDYVSLYNDDNTLNALVYKDKIQTVNVGVTYNF